MKKYLIIFLCIVSTHYASAQTYAYHLAKVVNSDTGELLESQSEDKTLIYITFTSNHHSCYESNLYGERINKDYDNSIDITRTSSEGRNYYVWDSNTNGIIAYKCTYKVYSYERSSAMPTYRMVSSGEADEYLFFSSDYKKLNINGRKSVRYTDSLIKGIKTGGKRTLVYERVENSAQANDDIPKQLW